MVETDELVLVLLLPLLCTLLALFGIRKVRLEIVLELIFGLQLFFFRLFGGILRGDRDLKRGLILSHRRERRGRE